MGFRDEYFFTGLTGLTYGEWSIQKSILTGTDRMVDTCNLLQQEFKSRMKAAETQRYVENHWQEDTIRRELRYLSSQIDSAKGDIVDALQTTCDYLGGALIEVRWAIEKNTSTMQSILNTLWESVTNESRQYYEQGKRCYEAGEYGLAKERFELSLQRNKTNFIAYQDLGLIAVNEDDAPAAIRNFELAKKFAQPGYYRALAMSHLARAYKATGDLRAAISTAESAAVECPSKPKFFYDLAVYYGLANEPTKMKNALKSAIDGDWNYWGLALSDPDLAAVREHVISALDELREREHQRAIEAIGRLSSTIDRAKKTGTGGSELSDCETALLNLKNDLNDQSVFAVRAVSLDALAWCKKTQEAGIHSLEMRMQAISQEIAKSEADGDKAVSEATAEVTRLRGRREQYSRDYQPWKLGCASYGIILFGWLMLTQAIVISVAQNKPVRESNKDMMIWVLSSFVIPPIVIGLANIIRRQAAVSGPQRQTDNEILTVERRIEQIKSEIARKRNDLVTDASAKIEELKGYKERLQELSPS